jgi:hypothetical protein
MKDFDESSRCYGSTDQKNIQMLFILFVGEAT